jgi:hypothetical protein
MSQTTTATNLQTINTSKSASQPNVNQYFNNFYSDNFSIGADQNDAIVSYFEAYTGNSTAGQALAGAVIYTAQAQGLDPISILSKFQALPQGQLTSYLAAFLNISRVPTSVLGIKNSKIGTPAIARTILP